MRVSVYTIKSQPVCQVKIVDQMVCLLCVSFSLVGRSQSVELKFSVLKNRDQGLFVRVVLINSRCLICRTRVVLVKAKVWHILGQPTLPSIFHHYSSQLDIAVSVRSIARRVLANYTINTNCSSPFQDNSTLKMQGQKHHATLCTITLREREEKKSHRLQGLVFVFWRHFHLGTFGQRKRSETVQ